MTLNCAGCKNGLASFMKKHDNPVLGAAPRRVDHVDHVEEETMVADKSPDSKPADSNSDAPPSDGRDSEGVVTTSGSGAGRVKMDIVDPWANWEDDTAIFNSKVAATVNGAPILNGEVLDRYSPWLIGVREDMKKRNQTPADYEKVREIRIRQDLPHHIQRKLLVERMKASMKADQIKQINQHIDAMFEKEIEKLKREMKVSSRTELELELNKKGTTLENIRDGFSMDQLAGGYAQSKMAKPKFIDRSDIVNYYQAHPQEFTIPAKISWEQIQISYGAAAGCSKKAAQQKLLEVLKALDDGVPFAQIAKKYSDGPTARNGGKWGLIDEGSLADKKLEAMMAELPIGELSNPYEGESNFQIVRVLDRKPASRTPLGDVQDEIRKKLEAEQWKVASKTAFMEQLLSDAVIDSKYIDQPASQGTDQ